MTIKQKLLEAVGEVDITDIGTEALVDILVSRIKAQDKRIQELHGENARERQRLEDETQSFRQERKKMAQDPLYGAYGQFCFLGRDNQRVKLVMQSGQIVSLFERYKKNDWLMQRITADQWEIIEENELGAKRK